MSEELWKTHCETLQDFLKGAEKQLHKKEAENARLKAEVERLKSLCDNLGMGGKHTVTAIVEENARLRKAGDAMYEELLTCGVSMEFMGGMTRAMVNWNDAKKDGKPSV